MKDLNQEKGFKEFTNYLLTDVEMTMVRGGDGDPPPDTTHGTSTPPVIIPELG